VWENKVLLRRFLMMCILIGLCGCDSEPLLPEVQVEVKTITLKLRFKDSCGSGFICNYDASCMSAIQLIAKRTSDKSVIGSSCTPLGDCPDCQSDRLGVLCDMIFAEVIAELPQVPLDDDFYLQIRGLHDVEGSGDACSNTSTSQWLMWGESETVSVLDMVDPVSTEATVECRVCEGGCTGLNATCPIALPTSNCLPSLSCDKRCDPDKETPCFDGLLTCDAQTETCVVPQGQLDFCSPCGAREDCPGDQHCIAAIGSSSGHCAPACPAQTCPSGAFCQPIGEGTLLQELP